MAEYREHGRVKVRVLCISIPPWESALRARVSARHGADRGGKDRPRVHSLPRRPAQSSPTRYGPAMCSVCSVFSRSVSVVCARRPTLEAWSFRLRCSASVPVLSQPQAIFQSTRWCRAIGFKMKALFTMGRKIDSSVHTIIINIPLLELTRRLKISTRRN